MMKIDISLTNRNEGHSVAWNTGEALTRIVDINSLQDVFDVEVSIQNHHFSSYAHSLKSLLMDLIINHRILLSGKRFSFFISETPLFLAQAKGKEVNISFYDYDGSRIQINGPISVIDQSLQLVICDGLSLVRQISPDFLPILFQDVHEDIASPNRADFIGHY